MEKCTHLNGICCLASINKSPSQAIELKVGNESDPTGQTVIRACGAAGWKERQKNCSGNPTHVEQPLKLDLIKGPDGSLTPWIT